MACEVGGVRRASLPVACLCLPMQGNLPVMAVAGGHLSGLPMQGHLPVMAVAGGHLSGLLGPMLAALATQLLLKVGAPDS